MLLFNITICHICIVEDRVDQEIIDIIEQSTELLDVVNTTPVNEEGEISYTEQDSSSTAIKEIIVIGDE